MDIRKMCSFVEEQRSEAGIAADPPLRKVAVAVILKNPCAGRFEANLSALTDASGAIGREMAALAATLMAPFPIESVGKGAIVGLAGEQEHGVAMLLTVFGDA